MLTEISQVFMGIMAIYLQNYRTFLMAIYAPALLLAFYFWLVPESVRWLISTGKYNRAMDILKQTAKQNNRQLSEKTLEIVQNCCSKAKGTENNENSCTSITEIFQHQSLIIRLFMCSLCWVLTVFVYYGLSVNATKIIDDNNKYVSYITTIIAEFPAAIITYFLLKHIGRRTTMFAALTMAGSVIILATIVPTHYTTIIRIMYFIGMCATSSAFAVLYVFSAEIWPTAMRNTLMNICSMIGRFGSMLAPLAILLVRLIKQIAFQDIFQERHYLFFVLCTINSIFIILESLYGKLAIASLWSRCHFMWIYDIHAARN